QALHLSRSRLSVRATRRATRNRCDAKHSSDKQTQCALDAPSNPPASVEHSQYGPKEFNQHISTMVPSSGFRVQSSESRVPGSGLLPGKYFGTLNPEPRTLNPEP